MTIQEVIDKFKETHPSEEAKIIEKAYNFAESAHKNQKRLNGEPITEHLLQTAYILAELRLDQTAISAGILHEIIDYTEQKLDKIKKEFGKEIAFLVNGLSRISKIKYWHDKSPKMENTEKTAENLRHLLLATAEDIRVILIKLANRLHNMKTLYALPGEKQKKGALETLEIYAPLAHRLGIGEIRGQLEDLAFAYAYPEEYQNLVNQVKDRYEKDRQYLEKIIPSVKKAITDEGIRVIEIHSRAKHYYSLYKKLQRNKKDWGKIYDLVAVRIIVPDIESCYGSLGVIHKKWRPLIGRIKDYIAVPKTNGYQSLHTTVFCEGGKITEFQIRTPKIHQEAEYGIAAHWLYKEGGNNILSKLRKPKPAEKIKKELDWIKQLREWQKEGGASGKEFIESLKIDFLKDRIFVFTPKGDIIDLPEGATPVDFAYQIHTDIGHQCAGAKIDGKLAPLSSTLENGQMVEILTKKKKEPNRDWLRFVKTTQAKNRIRQEIRKKKNNLGQFF